MRNFSSFVKTENSTICFTVSLRLDYNIYHWLFQLIIYPGDISILNISVQTRVGLPHLPESSKPPRVDPLPARRLPFSIPCWCAPRCSYVNIGGDLAKRDIYMDTLALFWICNWSIMNSWISITDSFPVLKFFTELYWFFIEPIMASLPPLPFSLESRPCQMIHGAERSNRIEKGEGDESKKRKKDFRVKNQFWWLF